MGSFLCVDTVTGLTMRDDEEVVALVIGRRKGGYPDAEEAATNRHVGAAEMFGPASLPVRGRIGDYGEFVPHPGQASVAMACAMAGVGDWRQFEGKATDFQNGKGIVLHRSALGGGEPELLGVTHFSAATWARLTAPIGRRDLDAEVPKVMDVLRQAAESLRAGRPEPGKGDVPSARDIEYYRAQEVLGLRTRAPWPRADGTVTEVPDAAGALSDMDDGATLHQTFKEWLTFDSAELRMYQDPPRVPSEEVVRGLLEVKQAVWGLDMHGRVLRPAQTARQRSNAELIAGLALDTFGTAARDLIARHHDDEEEALPRLRRMLDDLEALRTTLLTEAERAVDVRRGRIAAWDEDVGDDAEEGVACSP